MNSNMSSRTAPKRLPSDPGKDFEIYIAPGAEPQFDGVFRMFQSELDEVRKAVTEFFEKSVISPRSDSLVLQFNLQ